jgi:hypothetical protein
VLAVLLADGTDAVPVMTVRLRFTQHVLPKSLNRPLEGVVSTLIGYLVLDPIPDAVRGEQSLLTTGYCTVPEPMVITTGAFIVAVDGIF